MKVVTVCNFPVDLSCLRCWAGGCKPPLPSRSS